VWPLLSITFFRSSCIEWGKKGFHLVPTADDITKYQPTLLYNKQQVKKKELDDYDGNKFTRDES